MSQGSAARVFTLDQNGRSVYCNSPRCVSELMKMGWRLTQPEQLSALVRDLAEGAPPASHDPSDHFS